MAGNNEQRSSSYHDSKASPVLASPAPCDCKNNLEIKIRRFGGGEHYVYQCNLCGEQRGGSLKKADAIKLLDGKSPRNFDPTIEENRRLKIKSQIEKLYPPDKRGSFCDKVQKKIIEAKAILDSDIDLFLAEHGRDQTLSFLTARVVALRKAINGDKKSVVDRFKNEDELKTWFEGTFREDFVIYPEVSGIHVAEHKNVLIDYILYPKDHLIQHGFEPCCFGVEVKYFKQESEFTHKTSRGLWQTISYNDCDFLVENNKVRLKFGLIFSNLSFNDELDLVNNFGLEFENDRTLWNGLLHLANHAKIGCLHIKGQKTDYRGWEMRFVGNSYFTCSIVKKNKILKKSNENVIHKVRIGNF